MLDELDKTMRDWGARHPRPKQQDDGSYMAKEIAACLNQDYWPLGSASSGVAIVRGFLFQKVPLKNKLTPHAVSRALGAYVDRWRAFGREELALRIEEDLHVKISLYRVERRALPS